MKRVWRWIFNGLAAGSVAVCLALLTVVAVDSPTGFLPTIFWMRTPGDTVWRFYLTDSVIGLSRIHPWPATPNSITGFRIGRVDPLKTLQNAAFVGPPWLGRRSGFESSSGDIVLTNSPLLIGGMGQSVLVQSPPGIDSLIMIGGSVNPNSITASTRISLWMGRMPYWAAYFGLSVIPMIWCARMARRLQPKRKADGLHCVVCGYDLRATPNRCPECGTVPERAA